MKRLATPRALATVLVLSLGLAAGGSFAAPRGDCPAGGPGYGHGGPGAAHAMAPGFHGRAFSRLHDELKLDAQQEALWKDAEASAREHRDAMRARMAKDHAEIKAMLDQPGTDLRAVAKRMDELRAEGLKQRDAVRERWFAVYDSLGAGQKEKARLFFKDGAERMERMADHGRDRSGRGQPRHAPRHASAPAPVPAPQN
jgi:hypothetical protein